ncbi:YcxB family protein [Enterocloster lavalensis]|uniref:YcxB family protein n=1 Tax=Enterocloster lavalensis TaxID=460384 RepID=UPI0023F4B01C|nr:YcxB family protein [Enterocloster lavalensis]
MEPLFCIRMVLDESVLQEYAARNMQADRDGFKRMKFKLAGFLIALLLIGIVTRDPGRTLLTGGVAVAALAVLERKQRSQKGRREEFERQVNWMKQHLAPGELGSETVYCFLEQEMTWDNERSRGKLDYSLIQNVVETEQGFFVTVEKARRLFFWKNAFTAGDPQAFREFLEQRSSGAARFGK